MGTKPIVEPLKPDAMEVLWQLFRNGPTWDGDICSKAGRSQLCHYGYAFHRDGWASLTEAGLAAALDAKYDREKERWQRRRRQGL